MADIIVVRRQWNDWRQAAFEWDTVSDFHWDTMSGGVVQRTPQPFVHAYVCCNDAIDGEVAHSCRHGSGPHRIKVCITKKDNDPRVFAAILQVVGPKPAKAPNS